MSQKECERKIRKFIEVLRGFCDCVGERAKIVGPPLPQLETSTTVSVGRLKTIVDILEDEIGKLDREKRIYLCRMLELSSVVELVDGLLKAEWAEASHSLSPAAHRWKGFERAGNILTSLGSGLASFIPGVGGLLQVFGDSMSAICGIFGDHRADQDLSKQMEEMKKQLKAKIDKGNKDLKDELDKLRKEMFKAWKYLEANMVNLDARIVKVKKQIEEAIVELEDELYELKHQLESKIDELGKKIEEVDKRNEERIAALKKQIEAKIDELKKQVEGELGRIEDKFSGEFDSLKKQVVSLEKELGGLKRQVDDVKNELGNVETRLMTAMDASERRLKMDIGTVSSSLKGLLDRLNVAIADIRKRLETLEKELETLDELKKLLEEGSSEAPKSGG